MNESLLYELLVTLTFKDMRFNVHEILLHVCVLEEMPNTSKGKLCCYKI